jgi:protein-disulfide isomerase
MKTKTLSVALLIAQLVIIVVMLVQINALHTKMDFITDMATGNVDVGADTVVDEPAEEEVVIVEVSEDDDPWTGGENADVVIIAFSDFECPYCGSAAETMAQLVEEYGNDIKVVFRDFPLSFHANAQKAAEAAECAHEQDMFWEMHDMIFANQADLSTGALKGFAEELELDTEEFNECFDTSAMSDEVLADFAAGASYGVQGTPAFFINGELVTGAQPVENFREVIDKYL